MAYLTEHILFTSFQCLFKEMLHSVNITLRCAQMEPKNIIYFAAFIVCGIQVSIITPTPWRQLTASGSSAAGSDWRSLSWVWRRRRQISLTPAAAWQQNKNLHK